MAVRTHGDRGGKISTITTDGAYDAASPPSSSQTGEADVTMGTATAITVTVAVARGVTIMLMVTERARVVLPMVA